MAGDWIKAEVGLEDKDEVLSMALHLGLGRFDVAGRLLKFWGKCDSMTTDGHVHLRHSQVKAPTLPAVDHRQFVRAWIDGLVEQPGFAEAMEATAWLKMTQDGFELPGFIIHNTEPAKQRAQAYNRQRRKRQKAEQPPHEAAGSPQRSDASDPQAQGSEASPGKRPVTDRSRFCHAPGVTGVGDPREPKPNLSPADPGDGDGAQQRPPPDEAAEGSVTALSRSCHAASVTSVGLETETEIKNNNKSRAAVAYHLEREGVDPVMADRLTVQVNLAQAQAAIAYANRLARENKLRTDRPSAIVWACKNPNAPVEAYQKEQASQEAERARIAANEQKMAQRAAEQEQVEAETKARREWIAGQTDEELAGLAKPILAAMPVWLRRKCEGKPVRESQLLCRRLHAAHGGSGPSAAPPAPAKGE